MTLRVIEGGNEGGFDDSEWRKSIRMNQSKTIIKSHENVRILLTMHPDWAGKIRFDEFAERIMVRDCPFGGRALRQWEEADDTSLVMWIDRTVWKDFGVAMVAKVVEEVARANRFNPVRDYMSSLVWDGAPRVDQLFIQGFGAEDTEYARGVARRWLISAVARTFEPGCKADCIPVLEGAQGIRKSSGIRALCGAQWFNDSEIRLGHTDAYAILHGKLIHEIAELSSFTRAEVRQIKAYATSQVDHYRGAFERRMADHPRRSVFIATTNEGEWQKDDTGGRRWWPLACRSVNIALIEAQRDQLWAEAVALYRAGSRWWADTDEFNEAAKKEQDARKYVDPWQDTVEAHVCVNPDAGYTTRDILTGPLRQEIANVTVSDSMRVAAILRTLGYSRVVDTSRAGVRVRLYHQPAGRG